MLSFTKIMSNKIALVSSAGKSDNVVGSLPEATTDLSSALMFFEALWKVFLLLFLRTFEYTFVLISLPIILLSWASRNIKHKTWSLIVFWTGLLGYASTCWKLSVSSWQAFRSIVGFFAYYRAYLVAIFEYGNTDLRINRCLRARGGVNDHFPKTLSLKGWTHYHKCIGFRDGFIDQHELVSWFSETAFDNIY
jgi:hypothetical protein